MLDDARCLAGDVGTSACASFPAPSIGGGALNLYAGLGGDGVRSGVSGGEGCSELLVTSARLLRAGGTAGGGPLLDETVLPVC